MKSSLFLRLVIPALFALIPFSGWGANLRIDGIQITGNQTTKDFIILRELPFSPGDTIPENDLPDKIRLARENLNNLLLFNYVQISPLRSVGDSSLVTVIIEV